MSFNDQRPRKPLKNWALFAVALLSLLCFLGILFTRGSFEAVNLAFNSWITTIQSQNLTQAAEVLNIFDTSVLLVFSLPVAGYLVYRKETKNGLVLLGAMAADALLLQILKTAVASPRPLNSLIPEADFSFPSGHLTSLLVFLGMLTYFAYQNRKPLLPLFAVMTPVLGVLMALDRLYLNVHWLTDIIAAPFLALFIVTATILVIESLTDWQRKKHGANLVIAEVGEK
jgi:undecaprenyl-diphosphatase